jgi:hypothetical protein
MRVYMYSLDPYKGRIYRIYLANARLRPIAHLDKMSTEELVIALDSPNGWQRDTAQRLLVHVASRRRLSFLRYAVRLEPGALVVQGVRPPSGSTKVLPILDLPQRPFVKRLGKLVNGFRAFVDQNLIYARGQMFQQRGKLCLLDSTQKRFAASATVATGTSRIFRRPGTSRRRWSLSRLAGRRLWL